MEKRYFCLLPLVALGNLTLLAQNPDVEMLTPPSPQAAPAEAAAPKPTQSPAPKASASKKSGSSTADKPTAAKGTPGPNVVTKAPEGSSTPYTSRAARRAERVAFAGRTPAATVTPKPTLRRLTFFEFLFGPKKPKATPTPVPATPTPKPTPRKKIRPKATSAPDVASGGIDSPPAPAPEPTNSAEIPTPTPKKAIRPSDPEAKATPAPKPGPAAPISADTEAQDKSRYNAARTKALEDPNVQKLKEKADTALTDEEARSAQRAYNKALFNKIRSVDGSLKERADRIESSLMKRLEEQ